MAQQEGPAHATVQRPDSLLDSCNPGDWPRPGEKRRTDPGRDAPPDSQTAAEAAAAPKRPRVAAQALDQCPVLPSSAAGALSAATADASSKPPAFAEVTIRHGDDIPSVAAPTQPSNQSSQRPPPQIDHARLPPPLSRKPAGLGGSCLPSLECRRPLAPAVPPLPQTDHPRGLSGSGVPPRANLQPGSGTGLFPAATVCPAQGRGSFVGWMLSGVSRLQRNGQSNGAANPPPGPLASAPKAALHAVQQASRQQLTQKEPRQLQPLTPDKDDARSAADVAGSSFLGRQQGSMQEERGPSAQGLANQQPTSPPGSVQQATSSSVRGIGVQSPAPQGNSMQQYSGGGSLQFKNDPIRSPPRARPTAASENDRVHDVCDWTNFVGRGEWEVRAGRPCAHCQVKLSAGDRVWCVCDCPNKVHHGWNCKRSGAWVHCSCEVVARTTDNGSASEMITPPQATGGATRRTPGTPGASAAARASGAAQREHTAIAARADNAVWAERPARMEQECNADPPFDPLSSDRRAKRQRVGRSLFDAAPACAQPRRMNPPSQQQQPRLTEALVRQHEAAMDGREAAGQPNEAEQDRQSEGGKTLEYEPWPGGE